MSYQRLPTNDKDDSAPHPASASENPSDRPLQASVQAEFNRPAPAWWKRALLIIGLLFMIWLTLRLGGMGDKNRPQVIYATRYSEEFKYRPAASPVITEYLKDGRIRLRGASVGGVGIREEDMPITPERKKKQEKERIEQAREAAKEKLGFKTGRKKRRGSKVKSEI